MATYDNAYFSFAGTDLSSYVKSLDVRESAEANDDTVMGDSTRSAEGGLLNRSVSVLMVQNYASGGPNDTISGTVGTVVSIITAHDGSTPTTTNPHTTQSMLVTAYDPQFGEVGGQEQARVELVAAGEASTATA